MNHPPNKRLIFLISGSADTLLGGVLLLVYFGILPMNFAAWLQAPRWVFGVAGAVLFFPGIGVLAYQMTKTDTSE